MSYYTTPEGREIKRLSDKEYKEKALRLRLSYAPKIHPCKHCGHPVRDGYCCGTCGSDTP